MKLNLWLLPVVMIKLSSFVKSLSCSAHVSPWVQENTLVECRIHIRNEWVLFFVERLVRHARSFVYTT